MENEVMNYEVEETEVNENELAPVELESTEKKDHKMVIGAAIGAAATLAAVKAFGFIKKKITDRKAKKLEAEEEAAEED